MRPRVQHTPKHLYSKSSGQEIRTKLTETGCNNYGFWKPDFNKTGNVRI